MLNVSVKGYACHRNPLLIYIQGRQQSPHRCVLTKRTVIPQFNASCVSLLLYQDDKSIPDLLSDIHGLSLMPLPYAVAKAPALYYQNKAQNIEIALSMVDVSDITRALINIGGTAAAERVAGAYIEIGNTSASQTIIKDMKLAGYSVKPVNPFIKFVPSIGSGRFGSPYIPRIPLCNNFRDDDQILPAFIDIWALIQRV